MSSISRNPNKKCISGWELARRRVATASMRIWQARSTASTPRGRASAVALGDLKGGLVVEVAEFVPRGYERVGGGWLMVMLGSSSTLAEE